MVGSHRVQHDQEDVWGARRRQRPRLLAPRLEPVDAPERCRQDRYETGDDGEADPDQPPKASGMPLQHRDQPHRETQGQEESGGAVNPGEAAQMGGSKVNAQNRRVASQRPRRRPTQDQDRQNQAQDKEDRPD